MVVGVGKSGNIGHKIAATLNSTGATAVVLDSQNALHGDLGLLSDGDAVMVLSYSGETRELMDLLPFIKRFDVKLIALTGNPGSSLARFSEVTLDTSVEREACPLNLAPTSSSTAMLVMGDTLAMVLLESRGFTEEDFARFHPGGSLGPGAAHAGFRHHAGGCRAADGGGGWKCIRRAGRDEPCPRRGLSDSQSGWQPGGDFHPR